MKKNILSNCFSIIIISLLFVTIGCKRTEIPATPDPIPTTPTNPTGGVVNDAVQVIASVSGIVLDESNAPVANAVVTSGAANTTTNSNGMFIFQNISLSKENGSVTVVKAGYFKGIRSFKTTEGKNQSVRLQLMQRVLSGTVIAASGGTITSNGGATIVFPANAFVTSSGAAYTGSVNIYSRWIDPTATNLPFVIPGDLRGVSTNGAENILETYGMVGAELTDASGNILKIATGKTATVSFPIPASLSATAPATIILWHFDDATARWKENGTVTKTGSTYTAQVDKFSFWNCDVPNTNFINLDYTLINATTNSPLVSTNTRIKRANGAYGYGITNNLGFVSGLVPKNEALILEVVSSCGTVVYTQNIGPFGANTNMGNINANLLASQTLTFIGTVLNCNTSPVTDGVVSLYMTGGLGGYTATNAMGTFLFSLINCSSATLAYNCQAIDNSTTLQSPPIVGSASVGTVNLGNINTCGPVAGANVYVAGTLGNSAILWKNGVATFLANGAISSANSVFVSGTDVYVAGYVKSTWGDIATVWKNGIATNLGGGAYPNGSSYDAYGNSVFVSGTDVYVAGKAFNAAIVWKNGVSTTLAGGSWLNYAQAFSVFFSGTDVYVAGEAEVAFPNSLAARLWKNSLTTNLTTNGITSASAKSVFVSGTDVYVAGSEELQGSSVATVWKNGVATSLYNGSSITNSIFVSGTDVYVAGAIGGAAVIWKNGIATYLTNGSDAKSIFVNGSDIYVAGVEYNGSGNSSARIWKNGLFINLSSGTTQATANSIYIK